MSISPDTTSLAQRGCLSFADPLLKSKARGGRATFTFESVLSSDQFRQAEAQPGAGVDRTGDGVQTAANQRLLLPTMEEPMSLYSALVTHMSLKVESEHRMEPPTQAPYMEYGQVETWTGVEEAERGGMEKGREGKRPESKYCCKPGAQNTSPSANFMSRHFCPHPASSLYSNL